MKMYILGLIGLFAWNAVFGAFGGLLLCIHQDSDASAVLAEKASESTLKQSSVQSSCLNEHGLMVVTDACSGEDDTCVDIALIAELLPLARLQLESISIAPYALLLVSFERFQMSEPSLDLFYQAELQYVPMRSCWLTGAYLLSTVLRA
jgi:hypothetical protein